METNEKISINPALLSNDIALRIPAMANDSAINNANTIQNLIAPVLEQAFEDGYDKAEQDSDSDVAFLFGGILGFIAGISVAAIGFMAFSAWR